MSGVWSEDDDRRSRSKPSTLGPGIVEMSLRGTDEDVEALVAKLRHEGIQVWRRESRGTRSGNVAGYRYFTVEIPPAS